VTGRADLFDLIGMASPIIQAVLFLLLTFSVFSWAVILYKFRLFRSIRSEDRRFLTAFESLDDPKEIWPTSSRRRIGACCPTGNRRR
jgi:biopolymer transport protein TolQ